MDHFFPILLVIGYITFLPLIFVPTIRAFRVNHPHKWWAFAANVFLGWNIIGWIVMLSWSDRFTKTGDR